MPKSTCSYPSLIVDTTAQRAVTPVQCCWPQPPAGSVHRELSGGTAAVDATVGGPPPGKILLDLAIAVATGGDCLADIGQVRSEPGVFGHVASDPRCPG